MDFVCFPGFKNAKSNPSFHWQVVTILGVKGGAGIDTQLDPLDEASSNILTKYHHLQDPPL